MNFVCCYSGKKNILEHSHSPIADFTQYVIVFNFLPVSYDWYIYSVPYVLRNV